MTNTIEENLDLKLDFQKIQNIGKLGLDVVPVVVQEISNKEILIIAYANAEAIEQSLKTKKATFWSTSRNELWIKGATSGDTLEIINILVNCEQNSLLYLVRATSGSACHTKDADGKNRRTCYYRKLKTDLSLEFME